MKRQLLYQFLLIVCILGSCKIVPWDDFTYYQKYKGNADIRMDGYYFHLHKDSYGYTRINALVFYSNGLYLNLGNFKNHKSIRECITNYASDGTLTLHGSMWGAFIIEGEKLKIQSFNPLVYELLIRKFRLYNGHFDIINDSTLIFTKGYLIHEKKFVDMNNAYFFKEFNHKPDSTNNWIVNSDKINR